MSPAIEALGELDQPRLFLAGVSGGTGASTTATLFSEKMKVPVISGGKYFRGLANRFAEFQTTVPKLEIPDQLTAFATMYRRIFAKSGLDGVLGTLEPGIEEGADEATISKFQVAIREQAKITGHADPLWDTIVDQTLIRLSTQEAGFVLESKIAIALWKIDQLKSIVVRQPNLAIPFFNVLLQLDPFVAAQRISQREGKPISAEDVTARKQKDFGRYQDTYSINGVPFGHHLLASLADLSIDTQFHNPEQVVRLILQGYLEKVISITQHRPEIAFPLIQKLNAGLAA